MLRASASGGGGTQGPTTFTAPVEIDSPAVGTKELILKNFASQTANALEVQNSSGTAYVTVGPDTLAGDSATKNWLNITGTFPTTSSAAVNGVNWTMTGAGSSSVAQRGLFISLVAGYTGSSATVGAFVQNALAGTGATGFGTIANYGANTNSIAVGAGHNVGNGMTASGSTTLNMGGIGRAVTTASTLSVGLAGLALTGTTNVAGFFGLMSTAPTLASSAALIADNGAVAANIVDFRDNGSSVLVVGDGGPMVQTDLANTSAFKFQSYVSNSAEAGSITRVAQTAVVTFNTTSDETLKIDRGYSDLNAATDRVMAYRVHDFEWKASPGTIFRNPMARETYASNKDPMLVQPGQGKSPWSINMSGFIPDILMAVQNLQKQVNEMRVV